MVLQSARIALRQEAPDNYFEKCYGASLSIFMILRTLRIRSEVCGGTVSWQYGGVDNSGAPWQSKCGFWTPNPNLPFPHAWLLTEFGELVDLSCSFFHVTGVRPMGQSLSHDAIPMIWMRMDDFSALPSLQYIPTARFDSVDLNSCDELARRTVATSMLTFWGEASPGVSCCPIKNSGDVDAESDTLLDGPAAIDKLRENNSWVRRNSFAATKAREPRHAGSLENRKTFQEPSGCRR
jgi:hypothetical protein